jgi:hypothetical protein
MSVDDGEVSKILTEYEVRREKALLELRELVGPFLTYPLGSG